jgi:dolichol-phosphate mannosyltransferase
MADKPRVSIVIPAYDEAPCIDKLYSMLRAVCDPLPYSFEFLFVDDGSSDGTEGVLGAVRRDDERVRYLVMSRNFGHQAALSAGLAYATGDAVIMMDGDLQHPPSLIPQLLECWRSGYDVVNTVRLDTEGSPRSKKVLSRLFYWTFRRLTGLPLESGSADFRLMGRTAVDALNALPERHRFVRGLVPWLGFYQTTVEFHAPARWAGRPKYTLARSFRLAVEGVTSFNPYPLRPIAILGALLTVVSLAWGLLAGCWHMAGGPALDRFSVMMISFHFFCGCQLAALGIVSEYVGRSLEQVKGRPPYIVRSAIGFRGSRHVGHARLPAPHLSESTARPTAFHYPRDGLEGRSTGDRR